MAEKSERVGTVNRKCMVKKESEIVYIEAPVETVFAKLSDLRNVEALKERLNDPVASEMLPPDLDAEKLETVKRQLQNIACEEDRITIESSFGTFGLVVIQREEPSLIKFESDGAPFPLNMWIQLHATAETQCKMRVTVGADVNFIMQTMLGKPLQQAADGIATVLSKIPYNI